ncbi:MULTISPECIES: response regulator [Marinobacter]|uniref:response regulator n=1 Tax=Marinobacter TaxID=2742 RepID=UPI001D062FBD|nr:MULTISPECIES: response regulator [Marinobacter]MCK7567030.1 response regulator [Marinobacter xestospongiae]UDL03863.1 response regulator [Marinobacter sp. CA1]
MTRMLKKLGVRPLAARLLIYVLLFSVVLSLLATGLQLVGELDARTTELNASQKRAADLVSGSLANNIWLLNYSEVSNTLDTLVRLPDVAHAQVTVTDGEVYSAGQHPNGHAIQNSFPLTYQRPDSRENLALGTLTLVTSAEYAYQQLMDRAKLTLLFQSIVVMFGTLGLLMIVRLTLSRHLETMARYASRLNLDALIEPLQLKRKPLREPDELSEMENALNTMRLQLLEDTRNLRQNSIRTRDERDEAVKANHAKNQFLANVSHELRTPLQSVLGYASLLSDTHLDQEQREYVQTLQNASENLSAIINDLLDISSIEAGKLILEPVPFNLRDTLNDLINMLGNRAREKGLALELRVDENLPFGLEGDPVRIRQILLNLASNGIKFTDSGHVLISVEVLGRQNDKVRLRLAVEDTGVGINPDELSLVYEPYVQLGQRFQRQSPGAGLGLAICHQLVTLMNGTLDVESRPGEGSTFWVELSLPLAPDGTTRIHPDTRQVHGRRILVVDSYELSRKITLEMLSRHDTDIEAVKSAGEALTSLRLAADAHRHFDAVVLDGFVPDMDSDLLCRQIRSNPDWTRTRLLILSSNPQRGDAEHFRQAGADAFLSKSLRESCLTPILHQLFADADHDSRQFLTRFSLQSGKPTARDQSLPCGRMRVLLVEDNPVNRTLTRRLLEKLGCDVMTANDGEAASSLWMWHPFDIIFMDCVMPKVDGFEATRRLRAWELAENRPGIPVVALTASAMEKDEERCRQAGMNAFVAKPVNLEMLRAVLEQHCKVAP